jgi:hypothetical protein
MKRLVSLLLFVLTAAPTEAAEDCCPYCSCGDGIHASCFCSESSRCHPLCRCAHSEIAFPKKNFGVNTDRIAKDEVYTVNGRLYPGPIGQPIPDDSGKLHLTIIGAETERQRVLTDLATAPDLAEFRDRFSVQDYPADHWAVTLCGFYTAGHPTIYLQLPSGKVLHRQDDYDGPKRLAEALRRASSSYDAQRDPDLRAAPFDWQSIPMPGYLLLAGFVLSLLLKKG